MKILARKIDESPLIFNIDVYTDHPVFNDESEVAASNDVSNFNIPTRPVISNDRNMIEQWMIDDFEAFVENIECLCEDNYGLICTYTNSSKDHSHYYNYLAKDENGKVLARFRIRLRISNHSASNDSGQKKHKREELKTKEIQSLLTQQQISRIRPYTILLTVNDERYKSYIDAFNYIDAALERGLAVLRGEHT